ncbi:MAG: hypothetical protein RIB84_22480 [Sneathiellaceae bacterium]
MTASDDIPLPPSLRRIADAVGLEAALRLSRVLGGRIVSVSARPDNPVVRAIGPVAAAAVLELIQSGDLGDGVRHFEVPRAPAAHYAAIRAAVAAGMSKQDAASRFGLTARQVRRICNDPAADPGSEAGAGARQGNLF